MSSVTVSFTLDTEEDKDLIAWLNRLPKRQKSQEIRKTLYAGLDSSGVTLGDVYQAIKEVDRKLAQGVVLTRANETGNELDMPVDIAEALDGLGL